MKIIKWLMFTPFFLLLMAIIIFFIALGVTEANKAYWDAKIEKLCEMDGGAHVSNRLIVAENEIKNFGKVSGYIVVVN